jgi:Fic family protein
VIKNNNNKRIGRMLMNLIASNSSVNEFLAIPLIGIVIPT